MQNPRELMRLILVLQTPDALRDGVGQARELAGAFQI